MGTAQSRGFRRNPALDEELRRYISTRTGQVDKKTGRTVTLKQAILEFAAEHGLSRHTVNARWYTLQPRHRSRTILSGRPQPREGHSLLNELSGFVRAVQAVEGTEILDLCRGLRVLAEAAEKGQHHLEQAAHTPALTSALQEAQVSRQELAAGQEKLMQVLARAQELVADFSAQPDAAKLATLGDFIDRLQAVLREGPGAEQAG